MKKYQKSVNSMKNFTVEVMYNATLIEELIIEAKNEQEAIEKAYKGNIDDIIDSDIKVHDIIDVEVIE